LPTAVVAVAEGAVPAAAAIREHFGLTGLSVEAAQRFHDKSVMKAAVLGAGIPGASGFVVDQIDTADGIAKKLGMPVVLKIPASSGGRGVFISKTISELAAAMKPRMLAESFTHGIEMSVETLIFQGRPVFRNHTKYLSPRWANILPAGLPAETTAQVNQLADRVHAALGIRDGMTHMELFLTPDGPVFGEIAARPPGGGIMGLIEQAYEFNPWRALLEISLGICPQVPEKATQYAGNWFIHPGEGTIESIDGLDRAAQVPGILAVECRSNVGDFVPERVGSGQSIGTILALAGDPDTCAQALATAIKEIQIRTVKLKT
jgi:biotin carboxylase